MSTGDSLLRVEVALLANFCSHYNAVLMGNRVWLDWCWQCCRRMKVTQEKCDRLSSDVKNKKTESLEQIILPDHGVDQCLVEKTCK